MQCKKCNLYDEEITFYIQVLGIKGELKFYVIYIFAIKQ